MSGSSSGQRQSITVLVPCYNEQEALPRLFDRMDTLIQGSFDIRYTLMFVDDGSRDNTRQLIRDFASTHRYVEYLFLSRNFGKEKAMFAGIDNVDTDGLVIIDADLQDPPELIPQMAELWRNGYDDVYARRRSRAGESWLKRATSRWYYALLQKVSGIEIQKDTGDFRLLDRKCVDALKRITESERNSKALFSWIGFRKIEFLYDRDPRVAGTTKWNYLKLVHLAVDGITSFTTAPLKMATMVGALVSLVAVFYAIEIFVKTVTTGIDVPGYASMMVVILLLGGVQLLSLGIIGEYLGRIFMQTKNRPNYLVQERHGRIDSMGNIDSKDNNGAGK
ncbi:glycosyl hydrolase [Bifidobacterium margollesii]|uniref:Glycosyl hydrolase n=1 Tax=Bifidobacterium margollesii TaxID=2020964 RepID=A0A2N5JCB9_9BIFI|nr:glycosyltransferase family 2 protein [Bifidobacterium margollesii]PLS31863.1 glycosyl hydrolase [Bifidobacterium margollesii]